MRREQSRQPTMLISSRQLWLVPSCRALSQPLCLHPMFAHRYAVASRPHASHARQAICSIYAPFAAARTPLQHSSSSCEALGQLHTTPALHDCPTSCGLLCTTWVIRMQFVLCKCDFLTRRRLPSALHGSVRQERNDQACTFPQGTTSIPHQRTNKGTLHAD